MSLAFETSYVIVDNHRKCRIVEYESANPGYGLVFEGTPPRPKNINGDNRKSSFNPRFSVLLLSTPLTVGGDTERVLVPSQLLVLTLCPGFVLPFPWSSKRPYAAGFFTNIISTSNF